MLLSLAVTVAGLIESFGREGRSQAVLSAVIEGSPPLDHLQLPSQARRPRSASSAAHSRHGPCPAASEAARAGPGPPIFSNTG
ncbi:hypothetical protein ACFQYP_63235 [Nonomuraea antimicrobica]